MPGIATHHVFGLEVFDKLAGETGFLNAPEEAKRAFLLGNQGPDPLFYLAVLPVDGKMGNLGRIMHREDPTKLLCAIHREFVSRERAGGAGCSFAMGFMCHYLLDSTVHPLVYAQQHAICRGDEELSRRRTARAVHAVIETELDEYVLSSRLGVSAGAARPHATMLQCPSAVLARISKTMALVIDERYALPGEDRLYEAAVRLYRLAQAAIDSKSSGLRRRFDYLKPVGLATAYVEALSHVDEMRESSMFANDDHIPWPHPFMPDSIMGQSFDELYDRAYSKAIAVLPAFADAVFGESECRELTKGINFSGRPGD